MSFELPARLEVTVGNAGNARAVLSFDRNGTSRVECTYTGGASSMPPADALDFAEGRFFNLEGCSGGVHAGDALSGDNFRLELFDPNPNTRVAV